MLDRAELDQSWVVLGQRLAASRQVARLSQKALGGLIGCVRSAVSHVEHARRRSDRLFWELADQHCGAEGVLLAEFDALEAAEVDYRARCAVQQAQAVLDRLAESRRPTGASSVAAAPAGPPDPITVEVGPVGGVSREFADELCRLVERLEGLVDRRVLMAALGWVMSTAAGGLISPDEGNRLTAVGERPRRVDVPTIESLSTFLQQCKRHGNVLGPSVVHDAVLAQHDLARELLPQCPAQLRPRLLSLHSDTATTLGETLLELNNHDRAQHYFRDARIAAHEAGDHVHAAAALAGASVSAYLCGEACTAMDPAAAARSLAARTDDAQVKAYADLRAAAAHALDGQHAACLAAHARAREGLAAVVPDIESPAYGIHSGTIDSQFSAYLVTLGRPREALQAAQAAAGRFDPSLRVGYARCQVRLATALVLGEEIGEAARVLGAAAVMASASPSPRLTAELRATRAQLQPWHATHAVTTLDAQLEACGIGGPSPSSGG